MIFRKSPGARAFSLVEMLVTVAIILVLGTLLLPVAKAISDRAKAERCVSNLRNIGVMMQNYAADHNMWLSFMRDGSPTKDMWYDELRGHAGLTAAEARKAFGCPALPSEDVTAWYCYGMRLGKMPPNATDPGNTSRPGGSGSAGFYEFSILKIPNPSRFFLMADSFIAAGSNAGKQSFRIIPPAIYSNAGIHLRHGHRANTLFLDSHVETLGATELKDLGFTEVYDNDGKTLGLD